jgi:phage shock protein E
MLKQKYLFYLLILFIMFGFIKNLFSQQVTEEKLCDLIKDGAFLVDVRTQKEFTENYCEGSINIPLDSIESQINKFKNKNHIIVFCRSGSRSTLAKYKLEKNGFSNVINGGTWNKIKSIKTNCK